MRTVFLTVTLVLTLASPADAGGPASPVRAASEAETHEIAVHVRQPRWTCFGGRIAHRGGWGALRRRPGGGCPELPYAILVREDRADGWREMRRFWTQRAACAARRPDGAHPQPAQNLPAATRRMLLGCPASK